MGKKNKKTGSRSAAPVKLLPQDRTDLTNVVDQLFKSE